MEETKPLTKLSLLKSLVSPSTFPHLVMLAVISVGFFVLARVEAEVWSAYGFVAFSLAYLCLAPLSKNERLGEILRHSKEPDLTLKQSLLARLKTLAIPLVLGILFMFLIYLILGENGILSEVGSFLPAALGGLFVLWAVAQGRFFGLATMNAIIVPEEGESNVDGYSPVPSLLMTSTLVIVMTFAVTEGLRFFLSNSSFSLWPYLFSFAVYGVCIYISWGQRKQASMHTMTHTVARKWFWATQLFITWHVLSIYRSIDTASTDALIFIEELLLMIVTVFLAIWAVTSKGEGSESSLFTRDNALFWGLAFGYAYAGSVAMITAVMDDVRTVLIGGHILVVATVIWSQRTMLEAKTHRINSERKIVESVGKLPIYDEPQPEQAIVSKTVSEPVDEEQQTSVEQVSIGDPVDWNQTPEALGDQTEWDDEIELLD
ncbi:MAG: hypothetical protein VXV89_03175 [Candidatus Thermoplasmatota archaeon]|nr:hypothetical protein [Candidatus Thermoplasmatota archaeon]